MTVRDSDGLDEFARRQRDYFGGQHTDYMRPVDTPYVRRQVEQLVHFGNLGAGASVLEVGCGMGRYTFPLIAHQLRVEGLDISSDLLEGLRRADHTAEGVKLHCCSIIDHEPEMESTFDFVVGFFVLHHLDRLPEQMAAMARMLRPGGSVVFLEPNPLNPLYYVQLVIQPGMSWWAEKGILQMRPSILSAAFGAAGFRPPRIARFGFFPPAVANRHWAAGVETRVERVPGIRRLLPFQLISAALA